MLNLKKLLTKILTQITATTANGSASGSPSASLCRCVKVGNVVHISGYYRRSTNIAIGETLFTIPSAERPSSTTSIPAYLGTSTSTLANQVAIYSDGTIKQNASSTVREVFFSGTYTL